jgi:CBS domain containing-hemolysin-like protein
MGKDKEAFERSDLKHLFQPQPDDERQERNAQLLENAQELPKIRIRQCLVPRKEIIGIDSTASMDEVKKI